MRDVTTLVGNYVAVWNESNTQTRRVRIEALWAPGGTTCYRLLDAHGHDAIEGRVASSWDKWLRDGRYVFRPTAAVCHHDAVKCAWQMVGVPGGDVAANGLCFLLLDAHGRIAHDYQFNPSLHDAGELADRWRDAATEQDASRRRHLVAALWTPGGSFITDATVASDDAAIDTAIAAVQARWAGRGLALLPAERSQAHHHVAWLQFRLQATAGASDAAVVSHLLVRDDAGRVRADYQFEEPILPGR